MRRPAALALATLICRKAASVPGSHSGSSVNGSTPCSTRKPSSVQTASASPQAASISANETGSQVALNGPVTREAQASTSQLPRSRPSTSWTDRSGGAGASTSPPFATRNGQ